MWVACLFVLSFEFLIQGAFSCPRAVEGSVVQSVVSQFFLLTRHWLSFGEGIFSLAVSLIPICCVLPEVFVCRYLIAGASAFHRQG